MISYTDSNSTSLYEAGHLVTYLQSITSRERKEFYKELQTVEDFRNRIPLHFLLQKVNGRKINLTERSNHKLKIRYDVIKAEIYEIVFHKLLVGFNHQVFLLLSYGWNALKRNLHNQRMRDYCEAAISIQSLVRRIVALSVVNRLRKEQQIKYQKHLRTEQKRKRKQITSVCIIQRFARVYLSRKVIASKKLRLKSIIKIQKLCRRKLAENDAFMYIEQMLHQRQCCLKIQTTFRKFRCQQLLNYLRFSKERNDRSISLIQSSVSSTQYFKHYGAAFFIQNWWKHLHKDNYAPSSIYKPQINYNREDKTKEYGKNKYSEKINWDKAYFPRFFGIEHSLDRKSSGNNFPFVSLKMTLSPTITLAIRTIQQAWRYGVARRKLWKLIQLHYQKIITSKSQVYWVNRQISHKIYAKPKLFRNHDIGNPIYLPNEDISLERFCDFCGVEHVRWYDVQAKEAYCQECHTQVHSQGRQKNNQIFVIKTCVHCHLQLASKSCIPCKDSYCDACFFQQHSFTSVLKTHPFLPIYTHCQECDRFIATWKVKFKNEEKCVCQLCYKQVTFRQQDNGSTIFCERIDIVPKQDKQYDATKS